jgi:ATP-binding cassette subfamily C protein LapB
LEAIFSRRKGLIETVVAGVVVNLMALLVSLYTLLVYDRVVPCGALQTILVLTLGISVAVLYELLTKKKSVLDYLTG